MPAVTASGGRTQHRKSPEWSRVRLAPVWRLMSFENEDAWCVKLEDYLFRDIPNTIQSQDIGLGIPRPISRDGGADGFPHISWLDPNRNRRIVYLNRNSDNRKLNLNYPDNRFNDNCVLAGVRRRNPLYYLAAAREFPGGDATCRTQPPSIRPISSSGSESAMYLLLSKTFISHAS